MAGDVLALDTKAAIHLLNVPLSPAWATRYPAIALPAPVAGELIYGALNSQNVEDNLERVRRLISASLFLTADAGTVHTYARVRLELKRKGRPIPENDVWIAAICLDSDLPLATSDAHFECVDGLKIVAP